MKQKFLFILLNKYFLTLLLTVIALTVMPNYFDKFNLTQIEEDFFRGEKAIFYFDLDDDGWSEEITAFKDTSVPAIYINDKDDILIDQWNFEHDFLSSRPHVFCSETDNNNYKELYVFTQAQDSIFLNIVEPLGDNSFQINNIFIDTIEPYNGEYKASLNHLKHSSNTSRTQLNNEFVFSISTGFLGDLRHVYKYNFKTKKLLKSPHLTNNSVIYEILDIDNDGKEEYVLNVSSYCNNIDSKFTKRTDYSAWFTILDDDLSFYFQPLEFKHPFSSIQTISHGFRNENKLLVFNIIPNFKTPSKLLSVSPSGDILNSLDIQINNRYNNILKYNNEEFIIADRKEGLLTFYNYQLDKIKEFNVDPSELTFTYDINNDNSNELIQVNSSEGLVNILSNDFISKHSIKLSEIGKPIFYGKKLRGPKIPLFYVTSGFKTLFFEYSINYLYYFKYLTYLGVYLTLLSILTLVIKGYQINEEKKKKIQNQIAKLQLQSIKNKVDPHFVFNAMNTISEMTLMENKIEADRFISKFSNFMRETLNHSDKIVTTLEEELNYTENFIQLQQARYNNSFDYNFKISKSVDIKTKVPKHILFCYTENAIKHGLSFVENGLLTIEAFNKDNNLIIAIEDNGGGLKTTSNNKNSTGNGLMIMDQIFKLFDKLNNKKIHYTIKNRLNKNKIPIGTRVEIKIISLKIAYEK